MYSSLHQVNSSVKQLWAFHVSVSHYSVFPVKNVCALYQNPRHNQEVAILCDINTRKIEAPYYTDMHRLTTGISSEKCVGRFIVKFDVWLTVHRSSMWNKKPTRCHLVLYLFLLYKLLFISCSTCFWPPCAHPQELTTQWYFCCVWCSAVTMGSVISRYVQYLWVDMFVCFHVHVNHNNPPHNNPPNKT